MVGEFRAVALGAALLFAIIGGTASAQDYPNRTVRIIVPFAPGGATDLTGRILAQGLNQRLGQPFVVENKPGASGNIGTAFAKRAEADGYTLLIGTIATMSINNAVFENPGFNPATDFRPIALGIELPNLIEVNKDLPIHSLSELIDYARARPGMIKFGSTGPSSTNSLPMYVLKSQYGIDMIQVPYSGSGPIQMAIMAGDIEIAADNMTTAFPFVESNKIRALAITSSERMPATRNVPTVVELGYPELVVTAWFGLFAPAGTPDGVIARLNKAVNDTLKDQDVRQRLEQLGGRAIGGSAEEFDAYIKKERARWTVLLQSVSVKPQ